MDRSLSYQNVYTAANLPSFDPYKVSMMSEPFNSNLVIHQVQNSALGVLFNPTCANLNNYYTDVRPYVRSDNPITQ